MDLIHEVCGHMCQLIVTECHSSASELGEERRPLGTFARRSIQRCFSRRPSELPLEGSCQMLILFLVVLVVWYQTYCKWPELLAGSAGILATLEGEQRTTDYLRFEVLQKFQWGLNIHFYLCLLGRNL